MVKKVECFKIDESPNYPGKWVIRPVHENFHLERTNGSFNLIAARLMNLSYAQYLRFCRDICGAEIYGKNTKYPIAYFKNTPVLGQLVRLLNNRANLVLWEREHPDWQAHAQQVLEAQKAREETFKRHEELIAKYGGKGNVSDKGNS